MGFNFSFKNESKEQKFHKMGVANCSVNGADEVMTKIKRTKIGLLLKNEYLPPQNIPAIQ